MTTLAAPLRVRPSRRILAVRLLVASGVVQVLFAVALLYAVPLALAHQEGERR